MNGFATASREWINGTSMTSFRSLLLTLLFGVVILCFAGVACRLLLDDTGSATAPNAALTVRTSALTIETTRKDKGKSLADAILQVFVLALGIGAAAVYGDRTTSREHLEGKAKVEEAKEKGRISGTAAAAVAAQVVADAKNGASTAAIVEHPIPPKEHGE